MNWDNVRHFKASEFTKPDRMSTALISLLDSAREKAGVPIYITSSFREGDDGAHGHGKAVDISDNLQGEDVGSRWRYHVVDALLRVGFPRIGVYDRHLHVDVDLTRDQEVMWWDESK